MKVGETLGVAVQEETDRDGGVGRGSPGKDVAGPVRRRFPRPLARFVWRYSRHGKFLIDLCLWTITIPLAFFLRLEQEWVLYEEALVITILVAVPLFAFTAREFGFHRQAWAHIGTNDLSRVALGVLMMNGALFVWVLFLNQFFAVPRSIPVISAVLAILLLCGVRLAFYVLHNQYRGHQVVKGTGGGRDGASGKNVLVVGAGEAGTILVRELQRHPETGVKPVAFVDDDPLKQGLEYHGVCVVGKVGDLPEAYKRFKADEVLFTIPSARAHQKRAAFELADRHDIPIRIVPSIYSLLLKDDPGQVREVLGAFITRRRPRHVLLIGGAGYIGSALVPRLLDQGFNVRILDSLLYGTGPLKEHLDHPSLQIIEGDFRKVDRLVEAMQGIDTVIHLGGIVGDPACALDEDFTVEVNLIATKMVAEVAKGYGVSRFVFASTCSVYGASDELLDEDSALNPVSLYAKTKIASERVLLSMADEQFAPVILRFGTVYGFSGRTRFDLVVNLLTAKAVKEGEITLYGGDQWRPFIHVHDVAKAVTKVLEAPLEVTAHGVFNVGSNEQNYTLAEVARKVQAVVPHAKITDSGTDSDRRNYRVSFDRIRNRIGFTPDWTLEAGIEQVASAIQSGEIVDYKASTHSNVAFLTEEGFSKIVRKEFGGLLEFLEAGQPKQ